MPRGIAERTGRPSLRLLGRLPSQHVASSISARRALPSPTDLIRGFLDWTDWTYLQ